MLCAEDILAAIDLNKGNAARDSVLTIWLGHALLCFQVIPGGFLVSRVFFLLLVLQYLPMSLCEQAPCHSVSDH